MSATPQRYLRDPAAIYRESFAAIRREAPLDRLPDDLHPVALRLIHACGMPDIIDDLIWTPDAVGSGKKPPCRTARPSWWMRPWWRLASAPIFRGAIASSARCTMRPRRRVPARTATTRSAAAVDGWQQHLDGAVVAIGNAPTALFRLLELLAEGARAPGAGARFSGRVHRRRRGQRGVDRASARSRAHVALRGRRGGSAMAAAALNALLGDVVPRQRRGMR